MKTLLLTALLSLLTGCLATTEPVVGEKAYTSRTIKTLCEKGALRAHNYRCNPEEVK
jgi:hypothetical protein